MAPFTNYACDFYSKRLWHMSFPVIFAKFLRTLLVAASASILITIIGSQSTLKIILVCKHKPRTGLFSSIQEMITGYSTIFNDK